MDLRALVDAVLELRAAGASVVKIDPAGAMTVAFDTPVDIAGVPSAKPAAEQERDLLFASADD